MKTTTLWSNTATESANTATGNIGGQFIEIIIAGLALGVLFHYARERISQEPEQRRYHQTRQLQLIIASVAAVYFGTQLIPTTDAWPIETGLVIQETVQATAAEMAPYLRGNGLRARLYQIGLAAYFVFLILVAVGIRVPIIIWDAIFGS